jgi:UDP-glucose 4-epimerase
MDDVHPTVVITGAAGLIGANFSRYLTSEGYRVVGIDNLSGGYREHVDPASNFYYLDLLDHEELEKIFVFDRPDYVYHFAAYAAVGLSPHIRRHNYSNNIIASVNLINCSIRHNIKKFIFTSSMDVYGTGSPPYTEDQALSPEDPYGIAKLAVELDLRAAYDHFDLDYSIVRPHNVAGTYQNIWDKYRNVIGIWIRQIINDEPMTVYGDGSQVRAFSHVRYLMDPMKRLMTCHSREEFNIGSDRHCSLNDLSEIIRKVGRMKGYDPHVVYLENRKEIHTAYCDHTKAKEILGFEDQTDLTELAVEMFEWALTCPDREVKKMKYEINKSMYSYWR